MNEPGTRGDVFCVVVLGIVFGVLFPVIGLWAAVVVGVLAGPALFVLGDKDEREPHKREEPN